MDTTPGTEVPVTEMTARLGSLDPADAPDLAEELADTLAAELERPADAAAGSVEEPS